MLLSAGYQTYLALSLRFLIGFRNFATPTFSWLKDSSPPKLLIIYYSSGCLLTCKKSFTVETQKKNGDVTESEAWLGSFLSLILCVQNEIWFIICKRVNTADLNCIWALCGHEICGHSLLNVNLEDLKHNLLFQNYFRGGGVPTGHLWNLIGHLKCQLIDRSLQILLKEAQLWKGNRGKINFFLLSVNTSFWSKF